MKEEVPLEDFDLQSFNGGSCPCPRCISDYSLAQPENGILYIAGFVRSLRRFPTGRKGKKRSSPPSRRRLRPKCDGGFDLSDFEDI
jgi:hypothetical protein